MKLVCTLSMLIALAGASTIHAQATKAPAEKKVPEKAAPAPKEELSPAEIKKVKAFFDELTEVIVKSKAPCSKVAAGINTTLDKHQESLKKNFESRKEVPQVWMDKRQESLFAMAEAIVTFCRDDKDVRAATQRFDNLMKKKEDNKAEPARARLAISSSSPSSPPASMLIPGWNEVCGTIAGTQPCSNPFLKCCYLYPDFGTCKFPSFCRQ
jgi:hypothetical protein